MDYVFKNMQLPKDHGFDDKTLLFLESLDKALEKSKEGILKKDELETLKTDLNGKIEELKTNLNYEAIKEQINGVYIALEKFGAKPAVMSKEERDAKIRKLNSKWMRGFLKKEVDVMKEAALEIKTALEPVMHTGAGSDVLDVDMSQGGYLIPELLESEILRFAIEGGVARREFRNLPFSGPGNSRFLPKQIGNVVVSWIDEGEAKPKTKPLIGRVEQTLKKVAAICMMTEEIVEDAVIDLVSFVAPLIGEAIAAEEDDQFFAGTGAPWTGIINNADVVTAPMGAGLTVADLLPEHLLAMRDAIPSTAVPGAKFYMHRTIWAGIRAYRADAVSANDRRGNYLIQDPVGGGPATLWGYPVVLVEAMPSFSDISGEADTPFIIFGNLKRCCVYGDKKGIRVKLLDQASMYDENDTLINLAEQDMVAIRVHKRVGYVCAMPEGIAVLQTGPVS